MLKVCFIGNCQAQSLESLAGHLGLAVEVVTLPPVFDLQAFGQETTFERITSCDFVFNQRVGQDYPVEFARPDFLRERLSHRSVSWPNVYFDGYFPDIQYVYTLSGKVVGPLSDYHFGFVRSAWAHDISIARLEHAFRQGALAHSFKHAADRSLHELRKRENGLTVRMSDWIVSRWRYSKLLHVMNHPDNPTLLELLQRLLDAAGIDAPLDASLLPSYPYPLDEIQLPAFPAVQEWAGLSLGSRATIRGKRLLFEGGVVTMLHEPAAYDWTSLFESFYRLYDLESAGSSETAAILRNTSAWLD